MLPSVDSSGSNPWWPKDGSAIYLPLIFSFFKVLPLFGHHEFDALPPTDGSTLFNFLQCSYIQFFWKEYGTIKFFYILKKMKKKYKNIKILFTYFNIWFLSVFSKLNVNSMILFHNYFEVNVVWINDGAWM